MKKKFKIGILRETKTPPDKRAPLSPRQASELMKRLSYVEVVAQPSELRCYKDSEYQAAGIALQENLDDCDLLLGVKEVKIEALLPNKTYLFFAHVAKKQPHNQPLIRALAEKKITLLDYEYLTDKEGLRLAAFGHWAGVVGAYNALRGMGIKTKRYDLKPAHLCHDYDEVKAELNKVSLTALKILITGGGRVAGGARELLSELPIKEVAPTEYLTREFQEPVVCRIDPWHYAKRKDGQPFDWDNWVKSPMDYESAFLPYTKVTDILLACHYWDYRSPHFFTREDMLTVDFRITLIADLSCDIPGPLPSTIKASTIADPFFDYDPQTNAEAPAFSNNKNVTVMSIDNLPAELPRNSSEFFGQTLLDNVFPHLLVDDRDGVTERATILKEGKLTARYLYLQDYLEATDSCQADHR